MYPLSANKNLHLHNIRISELRSQLPDMSQSHRSASLPKIRMLSRGGRSSSGIRITNIKSIKPPDPEVIKKQEEEKLRAQLQKEIVSRSRNCAFKKYECLEPVVSNSQYCALHITLDPKSGYKQCSHMVNGIRCVMPAPSDKDNALCFEHAHIALHARNRSTAPPPPVNTSETLLNQLQHYVRPERARTTSCASSVSVVSDPADQDSMLPHPVDPFKQIDATAVNTQYSNAIMECFSGSESDCDVTDELRGSYEIVQPDEGEVENQPLWRAGVFTAEEAIREARDTLVNLQSAYKRQMDRLKVLLQTERLKYLKTLKVEKEQCCSINSQVRSGAVTLRERKQLKKLKAYAGYRRRRAVINDKLRLKRLKNDSTTTRPIPSHGRCVFSEYNVRCSNQVLPATKHCMKHILYDRAQVLFTTCGDVRGGIQCREPVAKLPLPSTACRYHTSPPVYTTFTLKKGESDSDSLSTSTATEFEQDILGPMALEGAPQEIAPND